MPLDLDRISALCFDVDGTLSDTDDKWVSKIEKVLLPLSILLSPVRLHTFSRWLVMGLETPGNLLYTWMDWLGFDDDLARIYSFFIRHKAGIHSSSFLAIPGIQEMLPLLGQKYPMAIVSARDETSTTSFLDQFSIQPYFKAVACSQTCLHTKPFPDPVLWAAEQLGVSSTSCLMIGDTTVDIKTGKAAGAQTVGVLCGFGTERELSRAGADLILPDTTALLRILIPG